MYIQIVNIIFLRLTFFSFHDFMYHEIMKDFRFKKSENIVESNPSSNRPVECALCKKSELDENYLLEL